MINIFVFLNICFLIFATFVSDYTFLVVFETALVLFYLLNGWGKGIILRELIAFHSVFVLLFMPLIGYTFYTADNARAKLFVKYMPIDETDYFRFVFPAVIIYVLVLCWPITNAKIVDKGKQFIEKLNVSTTKLHSSRLQPGWFMLIGSTMYFVEQVLPLVIKYIGNLLFMTSFTGFLMLYLDTKAQYRKPFIGAFALFVFYLAISTTMFTLIIYMGMTISSFLYINLKFPLWKKIVYFLLVAFLIVALQNVKGALRAYNSDQNRGAQFGWLLSKEISNGVNDFSPNRFFPVYERANQGFLVAKVIKYIPENKEFDNGKYLREAIFSSIVPRFLWPDKPMAGGRFTTKYFTGSVLVGYTSMNVSPVGEAYGSFGPFFGILYMGFLAFFIRLVYIGFLSLTNKIPILIYWFPMIFFQTTYSMETDSLQIFNSLFKSGTFVFILYVISPSLFGVERKSFLSLKN